MAFLVKTTLDVIRSDLLKTNYFSDVLIGEPKSPPADEKYKVYIWMDSIAVVSTTLNKTIEIYTLTVRVHSGLFQEPVSQIESDMAEVQSKVSEALFANYSLDNEIRNIDIAGQYGQGYRTDWGHVDLGGKLFRIADITLPLLVDDSAKFTA